MSHEHSGSIVVFERIRNAVSSRQRLPKVLYKYVSVERAIDVLRNRTLRFTQPQVLNDPFEFCPSLDLPKLKMAYFDLEDVKLRVAAGENRKSLLRGFRNFCLGVAHRFVTDAKATGVLSLGRRCDVPLMWSHYCNQHQGIVLGFDVTRGLLLASPNREDRDAFCDIGPVEYQKERYKFPGNKTGRLDFMFVKDVCWQYEEEWRVIRSLNTLRQINSNVYVADFPPEALVRVIQGLFTPSREFNELLSVIRNDYKNVEHFATVMDSSNFELDITTSIGRALAEGDMELEEYDTPNIVEFYRFTSKGELFKAMEIIEETRTFTMEKNEFDL